MIASFGTSKQIICPHALQKYRQYYVEGLLETPSTDDGVSGPSDWV